MGVINSAVQSPTNHYAIEHYCHTLALFYIVIVTCISSVYSVSRCVMMTAGMSECVHDHY